MNVLVTGGAGYIGSCVSQYLIDKGNNLIVIDNLSTGLKKNIPKKCKFYKCNIQDTKKIKRIFEKNKIDIVMHFAAYVDNVESILKSKKYFKNNYYNGRIFFSNCINNGINKIIYSSTAAVYGNKKKKINEKDILKPLTPYSSSKVLLEEYLEKNKKNLSCIVLRYFNVVGADSRLRCGFNINKGSNLFLNLCRSVSKNKRFNINGKTYDSKDGTTIRDFIHVSDLSEVHYKLSKLIIKKKVFLKLNCGYGFGYSVLEVLQEFIRVSKKKINYQFVKKRKGDIVVSISNSSKLKKIIKWQPKYHSLGYLVKSSLNWYKKMTNQ